MSQHHKLTFCSRSLNDILLFTSPQILRQIVQVMIENDVDNDNSRTKDAKAKVLVVSSGVAVAGGGRREQLEI